MAVTEALPGVTVEIVVNGQALHEYEDEDDAKTRAQSASYVEAQSGTSFEVRVHVKRGTHCLGNRLSFQVLIDGRYIDKFGLDNFAFKDKGFSYCFYGRLLADGLVQQPCFADLRTTDSADADGLLTAAQVKGLGAIEVNVYHKLRTADPAKTTATVFRQSAIAPAPLGAVHEKALKGQSISHNVELRTVSVSSKSKRLAFKTLHIDPNKKPAATYLFHYRSRASLQSMLLIPPSSSASQKKRFLDAIPREDLLDAQHEVLEGGANDDLKKLKGEQVETSPSRRKVHRNNQTTTIELDDNGNTIRETVQVASVTPNLCGTVTLD
ncbi:hypothetical protein Slin15195_G119550 [Septoria linicola]|uniref:DUF7918 domain-containing protein n=1 Tax=Septoria linicola TaxID=215465 RepID=A0A9Q9EPC1_9PEZI|nr:hypothetical protein Slin14017_G096540 [Septoria linicola]USW58636.1 hypothetical protein Slin15195_G119550 [Septoria linicola]